MLCCITMRLIILFSWLKCNDKKIAEREHTIGLIQDAQVFVKEKKSTILSHGTWVQFQAVEKLETELGNKMAREALALNWVQRKKTVDPLMAALGEINDTLKLDVKGLEKM